MCMMHMLMPGMNHADHDGQSAGQQHAVQPGESLLDILKRRYALGEITQAQFQDMKRVLGFQDGGATQVSSVVHGEH
jgi:uncharacterized membrane protein